MKKQLGWASKLGGVESLWISKVGHTVLARLMESQIWHQPTGFVGRGLSKGTMASAHFDARHFPVYHWYPSSCHSSAGAQRERV